MLAALLFGAVVGAGEPRLVKAGEEKTYKALIRDRAVQAAAAHANAACAGAKVATLSSTVINIADSPEIPARLERLRVTGCGRTTVENIRVARLGGSPPWRMSSTLPGDTLTDISQQTAAWPIAMSKAKVELPPNCQAQSVSDTYVAARPGHVRFQMGNEPPPPAVAGWFNVQLPPDLKAQSARLDMTRAWAEVWPIHECGLDRTVAVVFLPLRKETGTVSLVLPLWRYVAKLGPVVMPPRAPKD